MGKKIIDEKTLHSESEGEEMEVQQEQENLQIFVSGIPYEANEEQIIAFFEEHGDIKVNQIAEVKLPRYQDSGKCRGFAHVQFKDKKTYDDALKLSGKSIGARYLELKPAAGR